MSSSPDDELLAALRRVIEADKAELMTQRAAVAATVSKLARLRRLEAEILGGSPAAPRPRRKSPDTDRLADEAERIIRENGSAMRAIDIAHEFDPSHDTHADRTLEGRIYLAMKRRPKRFVQPSRGKWALRSNTT